MTRISQRLGTMYCFAYGSNMNFARMKARCHGSRFICRASLKSFKFVYDGASKRGGAVGNIVGSNEDEVWGGLFEITDEDLRALDKYEGYPDSYDRKEYRVQDDTGNSFVAIAYLRKPKRLGEPSKSYREIVIQGAKDCGLPKPYINKHL